MKLFTPLLANQTSAKEVEVYRVVAGCKTQPNLLTQAIARIKFNSKFTASKPRVLGNFFLKPRELTWIAEYSNTCLASKTII